MERRFKLLSPEEQKAYLEKHGVEPGEVAAPSPLRDELQRRLNERLEKMAQEYADQSDLSIEQVYEMINKLLRGPVHGS